MPETILLFLFSNPTWRVECFLIEVHSSRVFGGRGIGLAIERKDNSEWPVIYISVFQRQLHGRNMYPSRQAIFNLFTPRVSYGDIKDGASFCYMLRISGYSGFLRNLPIIQQHFCPVYDYVKKADLSEGYQNPKRK